MAPPTSFALALLRLDGVGRVTAHRILRHFPTHAALLNTPREQVLIRLKGVAKADALVARLFDEEAMAPVFDAVRTALQIHAGRHVRVWTPAAEGWPAGLDQLPRAERPVTLYSYGTSALLAEPTVSILGRAGLSSVAFETAQALVRHLIGAGVPVVAGAADGFDVVMHKLCYTQRHPSVMVAASGLAKLTTSIRPHASAIVGANGLVCAPFDMHHGPFPHDDRERALTQAALGTAVVVVEPQSDASDGARAPEDKALAWALDAGRPVFAIAGPDTGALSERVHRLDRPVDFDWVVAATRTNDAPPAAGDTPPLPAR
ncbi:MAG: DNA-processing protein DprA [Bacteroidota bacterium]